VGEGALVAAELQRRALRHVPGPRVGAGAPGAADPHGQRPHLYADLAVVVEGIEGGLDGGGPRPGRLHDEPSVDELERPVGAGPAGVVPDVERGAFEVVERGGPADLEVARTAPRERGGVVDGAEGEPLDAVALGRGAAEEVDDAGGTAQGAAQGAARPREEPVDVELPAAAEAAAGEGHAGEVGRGGSVAAEPERAAADERGAGEGDGPVEVGRAAGHAERPRPAEAGGRVVGVRP